MPISRKIDSDRNLTMMKASGPITLINMRMAYEALLVDPGFMPHYHILWDFSEAEADMLSLINGEELFSWIELTIPLRGENSKTAFVVAKGVDFGLARMFATEIEDTYRGIEVFHDLNEAIEWLGQE